MEVKYMAAYEILVLDTEDTRERGFPSKGFLKSKVEEISPELLQKNWVQFYEMIVSTFSKNKISSDFPIDEIVLNVSLSAEGKFQFIAGGSVEAKASLQIKIKPNG